MNRIEYETIEKHMLKIMKDAAHDRLHIYRVLYLGLKIAKSEKDVDLDVLIAACLLHDIGREDQFVDNMVCHAEAGAKSAYEFLINNAWSKQKAEHVSDCISTHRFRGDNYPQSLEAKILYDSDKIDATGALGIARSLIYEGIISEPIYRFDSYGLVLKEFSDEGSSFVQEYNFKLKNVYNNFYTALGRKIADEHESISKLFYKSIINEVTEAHTGSEMLLKEALDEKSF